MENLPNAWREEVSDLIGAAKEANLVGKLADRAKKDRSDLSS